MERLLFTTDETARRKRSARHRPRFYFSCIVGMQTERTYISGLKSSFVCTRVRMCVYMFQFAQRKCENPSKVFYSTALLV